MNMGTVDVRDVAGSTFWPQRCQRPQANVSLCGPKDLHSTLEQSAGEGICTAWDKVPTTRGCTLCFWLLSWFDQGIAVILPRVGKPKSEVDNSKVQRMLGLSFTEEEKSMIDAGYACIEHRLKRDRADKRVQRLPLRKRRKSK